MEDAKNDPAKMLVQAAKSELANDLAKKLRKAKAIASIHLQK